MMIGKAVCKGNKILFDKVGWTLVLEHARKKHLSPKRIVIDALKRGFKKYAKKKESKGLAS